jgi:hypothetical protein
MRSLIVSVVCLLGAGCVSMDDVRGDRSGGTAQVYAAPKAAVLSAIVNVLRQQGVEALERSEDPAAVFGTIPESFFGDVSSTYCGVWIEEASADSVEVRVVTRRRRSLSLLTGMTESTFHAELERELARGRASALSRIGG